MAENRLKPLPAMGRSEPVSETIGALAIVERPDFALASIQCRRGRKAEFARAARKLIGHALPQVGRHSSGATISAFWTMADQWMLEAPHRTHEHLAQEARSALGTTASVTEQTDGWVRFDMEGGAIVPLLERLCSLDLRSMPADGVSRSIIEHVGCFIIRRGDAHLSIYCARSYAASLHHSLVTAARSIIGIGALPEADGGIFPAPGAETRQ